MRLRWSLASPVLRVTTQGVVTAILAAATFIVVTSGSEINETAASVLVAIVFGVATVYQVRQSQRRQHTVELLNAFQSSEVLSAADVWMVRRIAAHQPIGCKPPEDDDRHVISLLDYYEFLAALALRGLVDVPLLLSLRGGTMTRCMRLCRGYIDHRRTTVGNELYRCFEALVDEYARRTGDRTVVPTSTVGRAGR